MTVYYRRFPQNFDADNYAVLRTRAGRTGAVAYVYGRETARDGGEGQFIWDATITAGDDDDGTVLAHSSGVGGWRRAGKEPVRLGWFGGKPDGSDAAAALLAAAAVAEGRDVSEVLIDAEYTIASASQTVDRTISIVFQKGGLLTGAGVSTLTLSSKTRVLAGRCQIFSTKPAAVHAEVYYPEWLGAKADGFFSDPATGAGGAANSGSNDVGVTGYTFTSADIGKIIRIDTLGAAGGTLVGNITAVNPGGLAVWCTIDVAAGGTGTGKTCFVGTDSGQAINDTILLAHRSTGRSATVSLDDGIYCSSQEIQIGANTSANIQGRTGDIRHPFSQIAVCQTAGYGLYIVALANERFRARVSGVEIYGCPDGLACIRNSRTNTVLEHFRTEYGQYGLYVRECYTARFSNFFIRRAASHGIYSYEANHNWYQNFQSNTNGGHGVYAQNGAVNVFDGEYNDNALGGYRFTRQQNTKITGYGESTIAGASHKFGTIDDDCIGCEELHIWRGALHTTRDDGMASYTLDSQGTEGSKCAYPSALLTNLQTDSEFLAGVGGFTNGATPCTVTQDTSVGYLSGHSLRIRTDVGVTSVTNVNATRTIAHVLQQGEQVIIRGWARSDKPMFYETETLGPTQPYFQVSAVTDAAHLGDNVHTFYVDNTCWRPFVAQYVCTGNATSTTNINLSINRSLGNGATQDTVWVTGLEVYILPARDAADDSAARGKDFAKLPYVRTFANATQSVNLGAFAQCPVVATADLPAAGAHMDGTILIEDTGATLNLVLYGAGIRVTK